jgi:hypothetical protein
VPAAGRTHVPALLAVLLVIAATAVLLLFNPWLSLWLLAGILAGWAVRTLGHAVQHHRAEAGESEARGGVFGASPLQVTSAAIGLVGLVGAAIFTAATALFPEAAGPPHPTVVVVVPVTYDAQAKLVDARDSDGKESFALAEQVLISEAAIAAYAKERRKAPRPATDVLAGVLARNGWGNPQLRAGTLRLERRGRPLTVEFDVWSPRTTVTLAIPPELSRAKPFVLDGGSVEVSGAKHAVLETTPASESTPLAAGRREQHDVTLEPEDDEVIVEVANPRLRNDLGAFLLGLSAGAFAKGAVLLVWGLFLDRIKEALKAIFKKEKNKPRKRRPPRAKPQPKTEN